MKIYNKIVVIIFSSLTICFVITLIICLLKFRPSMIQEKSNSNTLQGPEWFKLDEDELHGDLNSS
jgi:hypothetical protein